MHVNVLLIYLFPVYALHKHTLTARIVYIVIAAVRKIRLHCGI